ncbi:hypothetical protein [Sandaracinus amylolyticus]|uniref:hypothetical protein n=1 Tax=Sandaracinus amylolyticus TaxID=927083 RepID=UPI001F37AB58|nr:hypothetical protein [Sandaracinus amylolyticus]UJR85538.1 Hypothetical protein I5071_76180 [Sandaracinus amylolyticus]
MDVEIIVALIGVVGSLLTTIIGALLNRRRGDEGAAPQVRRGRRARVPDDVPARFGPGSLALLAIAGFLGFTGAAMVLYVVLSFITSVFVALQGNSPRPDLSGIPFVPFLPLGFGLAFAGIVVAWIAAFAAQVSMGREREAH